MSYWGYGKEFNPQLHSWGHMNKQKQKEYIEKKERKFNMARAHAEALADISIKVMTLRGKNNADEKES